MKRGGHLINSIAGLVATGCLLAVGSLQSDSYRCGNKLVRTGDTSARVLELCGEPNHKDRGHEQVKIGGARKKVSVQRWYYQKGSQSLGRVVFIYRGEVVAIDTESR